MLSLTREFNFSVFDERSQRFSLGPTAVWHNVTPLPSRFGMWIHCSDAVPSVSVGTTLLEYHHPPGGYGMDTEDDARKLGYEVGAIFCTFLQGVVLGWGTIDRGVGRAKQGLSLIIDDRSILMDGGMEAALFEAVKTRAE